MADLVSKLGQTILSKTKESITGFGQGMKGAFISANPAIFGPAVRGIEKKISDLKKDSTNEAKERKEESRKRREEAQRALGFSEERASEQRKFESAILEYNKGTYENTVSIDKTTKQILEQMKKCCETSSFKMPNVPIGSIPKLSIPEIKIPEIKIPKIRVPEIEVPRIRVPVIEVPRIRVPQIEVPRIRVPELEVPKLRIPQIEVPRIRVPELEIPKLRVPELEIPKLRVPELEIPKLRVPELEIPKLRVLELEVPKITYSGYYVEPMKLPGTGGAGGVPRLPGLLGPGGAGGVPRLPAPGGMGALDDVIDVFAREVTTSESFIERIRTSFRNIFERISFSFLSFLKQFEGTSLFAGIFPEGGNISEMFGNIKTQFLQAFETFRGTLVGKVLGGVLRFLSNTVFVAIIATVDGIFAAFDTKTVAETFNMKEGEVDVQKRILSFLGGFYGNIIGFIPDALAALSTWIYEKITGNKVEYEFGDIMKGFSKFFSKIFGTIVGALSGDDKLVMRSIGMEIAIVKDTVSNFFRDIGNWFIDRINMIMEETLNILPDGDYKNWMREKLSISRLGRAQNVEMMKDYLGTNPYLDESRKKDIYKTPSAPPVEAEAQKLMNVPGAYRGASVPTTEQDLVAMGLKIKPGYTQVAGRGLSPLTIRGADWLQNESGFPIDRFTGFNDGHPREKSSQDSHSKGLAFDFTIPQNLATDDNFRKSLAKAISESTGAYVVDEYAIRTANWTGGHFHVDFSRASGVDLGTGVYAGFNWKNAPDVNPTDVRLGRMPAPPSIASDGDVDASTSFSGQTSSFDFPSADLGMSNGQWDVLPPLTKTAIATQTSVQLQRQQLEEQRRQSSYVQRREILFEEFNNNMKNIFRPMVNALMGPGMSDINKQYAGSNLSMALRKDFEKVGVQIFGKQYGPAMGQTFQKLAGVYMDQFIDQTLAPMLGMNADMLNRSINTYLEGKSKYGQAIKDANKALETAKATLTEAEKKSGFSLAEIVKTAGTFKGFSPEQLSRISQLTGLRQNVSKAEENLAKQKALRNQYNMAALEDFIFGSTGFSIGPRTMIEQYGGPEKLTQDLATLFGAPIKPVFGLDEKDNRKLQAESSLYRGHVQGQQQVLQNHLQGQQQINSQFISAYAQVTQEGAVAMQRAVSTAYSGSGTGLRNWDEDNIIGAVSSGVQTGLRNWDEDNIRPSGTSIPGFASGGGIGGGARGGGGLADFGMNLLGNMLGGRVAQKIGVTNPFVGKLFSQFGSNLLTGKDAFGGLQKSLGQLGSGGFGNGLMAIMGLQNANVNSLGGALGTALNAYQLYGFLKGGSIAGGVGTLGQGISYLGQTLGSSTLSNFGAGMATVGQGTAGAVSGAGGSLGAGASAGSTLASAGAVLAGAFGGRALGQAISGGYSALGGKSGNTAVNAGTAIGAFFGPVGALAGGAIGGAVNRLFGSKTGATGVSNLSGTLGGGGASLQQSIEMRKKYGWFRFKSDKVWNESVAIDPEVLKAFTETTKEISGNVGELLKPFGQLNQRLDSVFTSFNIRFTGGESEEQKLKIIQAEFEKYRDSLIKAGNPFIEVYKKTSETLVEATARLANALATSKDIFSGLGFIGEGGLLNFFGFNAQTSGLNIKTLVANKLSELQDAFGGLENFQNEFANLVGKMFTPEEQAQINLVRLNEEFKEYSKTFGGAGGVTLPTEIPESIETAKTTAKQKFQELRTKYASGAINAAQFRDGIKAINAYLLAAEQNASIKANQPATNGGAFDPSKYIPLVNELGDVVSSQPSNVQTPEAKKALDEAYKFVNEFTGVQQNTASSSGGVMNNIMSDINTAITKASDAVNSIFVTDSVNRIGDTGGEGNSSPGSSGGLSADAAFGLLGVGMALSNYGNLAIAPGSFAAAIVGSAATSVATNALSSLDSAMLGNSVDAAAAAGFAAADGVGMSGFGSTGNIGGGGDGSGGGGDGGGGGGSGCVDPNVSVFISPTESKTAGNIKIGDSVYTLHEHSLKYGMYRVIDAQIIHQPKILITFDDHTQIKVSTTHKFLLTDGSWKEMFHLDVGAKIQTIHGGHKTIIHIQDIGEGDVVMLTVENAHTYISDGLISHNMKAKGGTVRTTRPYIVGEVGPEIFIPNIAGTIVPTHKIIEAVQNATSLDTQTRNLLNMASPNENPITQIFLDQQNQNKVLTDQQREVSVNSAIIDNSVTSVSSPRTNIINQSENVRSSHPVAGVFTRAITGARI